MSPLGNPRFFASASSLMVSRPCYPPSVHSRDRMLYRSDTHHNQGLLDAEDCVALDVLATLRIESGDQRAETSSLDHAVQMVGAHVVPVHADKQFAYGTLVATSIPKIRKHEAGKFRVTHVPGNRIGDRHDSPVPVVPVLVRVETTSAVRSFTPGVLNIVIS